MNRQSARVRHEENLAVLGEGDPVRHRCIWENLRNLPVIWRDAVHGVPVKLHSLGVSDEDAPYRVREVHAAVRGAHGSVVRAVQPLALEVVRQDRRALHGRAPHHVPGAVPEAHQTALPVQRLAVRTKRIVREGLQSPLVAPGKDGVRAHVAEEQGGGRERGVGASRGNPHWPLSKLKTIGKGLHVRRDRVPLLLVGEVLGAAVGAWTGLGLPPNLLATRGVLQASAARG
mmetsp:Transcript_6605/g.23770  ORF Transcript_6605/g.23770 Transcript_6605/m.23770 type:complete len:230 (+) Transcript_6605:2311-3000(+)